MNFYHVDCIATGIYYEYLVKKNILKIKIKERKLL